MVLMVHGVVKPFKSSMTLFQAVAKHLAIPVESVKVCEVVRRSIDARKRVGPRREIKLVYNVHVTLDSDKEDRCVKNGHAKKVDDISPYVPSTHMYASTMKRPIVIGSGPAGLFAAYTLLKCGLQPIIIEQGPRVERRAKDVMNFWKHNILTPNSNGVFGEGGAGAFSDGKLTTRTSSPYHRFVHETLIQHGAKPSILVESRAHIGTDQLRKIISNFSRDGISRRGGTFLYNTLCEGLVVEGGQVRGVEVRRMDGLSAEELSEWKEAMSDIKQSGVVIGLRGDGPESGGEGGVPASVPQRKEVGCVPEESCALQASHVFLATGHSARDVYDLLHRAEVAMRPKDFAIGLRLQVSQRAVNALQYGSEDSTDTARKLGAAEFTYKYHDDDTGRSVYTFCMCPGGVVVNASHGGREVAVNGMSYSSRASRFANAAFVVTVGVEDFVDHAKKLSSASRQTGGECAMSPESPLSGMHFQKYWEQKCFGAGGEAYSVPAQRAVDSIRLHESGRSFELPRPGPSSRRDKGRLLNKQKAATKKPSGGGEGDPLGQEDLLPDHIFMGSLRPANLHDCLPDYVNAALVRALMKFATAMPGVLTEESLLMGIESRTSSPVRVDRNPHTLESVSTRGLYPLGEGAGYAGGIMTACVDGVRAVEAMVLSTDPSRAAEYLDKQKQEHSDDGVKYNYDHPAW